jgi:hypothetical protein
MGQRNHDRVLSKAPTHSLFQRSCAQKTFDRELADGDQHAWLQQLQLGIQPV